MLQDPVGIEPATSCAYDWATKASKESQRKNEWMKWVLKVKRLLIVSRSKFQNPHIFMKKKGLYQVNGKNNLRHFFFPKSTNLTENNGNLMHID